MLTSHAHLQYILAPFLSPSSKQTQPLNHSYTHWRWHWAESKPGIWTTPATELGHSLAGSRRHALRNLHHYPIRQWAGEPSRVEKTEVQPGDEEGGQRKGNEEYECHQMSGVNDVRQKLEGPPQHEAMLVRRVCQVHHNRGHLARTDLHLWRSDTDKGSSVQHWWPQIPSLEYGLVEDNVEEILYLTWAGEPIQKGKPNHTHHRPTSRQHETHEKRAWGFPRPPTSGCPKIG